MKCLETLLLIVPFCGKIDGLSVNRETGQWVCHTKVSVCGKSGGPMMFLEQLADAAAIRATRKEWATLSKERRLPARAFKRSGVGKCPITGRWIYSLERC